MTEAEGGRLPLPWREIDVIRLRIAQRLGRPDAEIAARTQHCRAEVDVMRFVMLGRTARQAAVERNLQIGARPDAHW